MLIFDELDRVTGVYMAGLRHAGIQGAQDYVMADIAGRAIITDAYRKRCEVIHLDAVRLQRAKEKIV